MEGVGEPMNEKRIQLKAFPTEDEVVSLLRDGYLSSKYWSRIDDLVVYDFMKKGIQLLTTPSSVGKRNSAFEAVINSAKEQLSKGGESKNLFTE